MEGILIEGEISKGTFMKGGIVNPFAIGGIVKVLAAGGTVTEDMIGETKGGIGGAALRGDSVIDVTNGAAIGGIKGGRFGGKMEGGGRICPLNSFK